ncbi:MAG TPA: hypothetical protein VET48_04140, partial [Steroidobacteraceae bacterium]|nr:hypothetical protein [Steroidobacteraceae bacterium]
MKSLLRRLLSLDGAASPWSNDALIREELFSIERLEQHARSLAQAQIVATKPQSVRSLNSRLRENAAVLLDAYRAIAAAVADGEAITPAAEWLIDNYHLVEEQIRLIHDDLPPRFYRQLPKLASGPFVGYPRVLGIAWACVAHSDSRFDPDSLRRFVHAYQQVEPLTIGELWAIAITLRIVLVENLRRAAARIVSSRVAREAADRLADRLLGINGLVADPEALIRHHDAQDIFSPTFVVQVVKRLRDQDPRVTPALQWLEKQLATQGTTGDEIVHTEHQRQGASNVTVRNIITSMRLISDVNWPDFFEDVSLVDQELRAAQNLPCEFANMDFATRNLYRSAIEELARGSAHTELEIARAAIDAVDNINGDANRERDPGYHLLARGRPAFERAVGYRAPLRHWLSRFNTALGPCGYIGAILLLGSIVLLTLMLLLKPYGIADARLIWLALIGLIPAIDVAV